MSDEIAIRARNRALLTDTLPYEVPVIFSNDKLYAALVAKSADPRIVAIVDKIYSFGKDVTKPYSYSIVKDGKRFTTLGIIHPVTQRKMAAFYETFSQSMLASCAFPEFSLRRPNAETPLFSEAELSGESTFKFGIPHIAPEDGELDVTHFTSYFSYGRYNLLGKFVESEEFRRLEKRFRYQRTIDVSKCFFNIYTHSVAWAVKGKEFSKKHRSAFSFESSFDGLMQAANYGETNGIVVGPEMSRIFAEIIFQDIDKKIFNCLKPQINNRDYAIRRYVDDYFIFSNSQDEIEKISSSISDNLETYKLFANKDKQRDFVRPFVSLISLARSEIQSIISELYDISEEMSKLDDVSQYYAKARSFRAKTTDIRQVCARHGIAIGVVSGWLLSNLRNILQRLIRFSKTRVPEDGSFVYSIISAVLEVIFYICAVDLRVRTTYTLCQCLGLLEAVREIPNPDVVDRLLHLVAEEMSILIRNGLFLGERHRLGVEMSNLLISGYRYLGSDFLRGDAATEALRLMVHEPGMSYFRYITAKFCLRNEAARSADLNALNAKAIKMLDEGLENVGNDAELYLLFVDILGSPDIDIKAKASKFKKVFGGTPSNNLLEQAFNSMGFVDWTGVSIQHTLERKALRPVYTWS